MTDQPNATVPASGAEETARGLLLEVTGLTKRFGGLTANRDINLTIPRRSIVSVIGPNGAGKTTLFNQITGFAEPTEGSINFDGIEIAGLSPHTIVGLGMARTYQNIRLFQNMTVVANVLVGHHVRMSAQWWQIILGLRTVRDEEARSRALALELLDLVGLSRRYQRDLAKNLP